MRTSLGQTVSLIHWLVLIPIQLVDPRFQAALSIPLFRLIPVVPRSEFTVRSGRLIPRRTLISAIPGIAWTLGPSGSPGASDLSETMDQFERFEP